MLKISLPVCSDAITGWKPYLIVTPGARDLVLLAGLFRGRTNEQGHLAKYRIALIDSEFVLEFFNSVRPVDGFGRSIIKSDEQVNSGLQNL